MPDYQDLFVRAYRLLGEVMAGDDLPLKRIADFLGATKSAMPEDAARREE